jgi:putative tryptophan/tyrosine transport system substrate-binding protein
MKRREFITGLVGAAASPVVARAQQAAMPVIVVINGGSADASSRNVAGFRKGLGRAQQAAMPVIVVINGGSADASSRNVAGFRKGLGAAGYIEGQNATIEYHWLEGQYDRLPALTLELVHRQVDVIIAETTPAALAAKTATTTIPIVFIIGADPVKFGLVASLNRPGGNVTGISVVTNALGAKNLELLHELVQVAVIAMLVNPANQNAGPDTIDAQAAARVLGLRLLVLNASDQSGIEASFATLVQQRAGALLVGSDLFFVSARDQLVALAARHRIPAIYDRREFTAVGGLVSYGPNIPDSMRQVGTGRILKGEKAADLPVQQPTRLELVINLKTAKALGLDVPEVRLATANEVIE